jgi:8-oxo-dGTP pyrophosphatase MutT (NUDIX family)
VSSHRVWQYRTLRHLGRFVTCTAAILTFGRMPPFVSASAIVLDGDRILAVLDPISNQAVLPGGHLRWKERPQAALIREVREETGYIVETQQLVNVCSGDESSGEFGNVRIKCCRRRTYVVRRRCSGLDATSGIRTSRYQRRAYCSRVDDEKCRESGLRH